MTTRLGLNLFLCFLFVGDVACTRGPLTWQRMTFNQPITHEDVDFIIDGTTRLSEVLDRLGSPNDIQPVGNSVVARYHFSDGRYFRGDYGWGLRFVLPFLSPDLVLGGGGFGTDTFQLLCDQQWIVKEHAFAWHAHSSNFRLWPFGESAEPISEIESRHDITRELPLQQRLRIMPSHASLP